MAVGSLGFFLDQEVGLGEPGYVAVFAFAGHHLLFVHFITIRGEKRSEGWLGFSGFGDFKLRKLGNLKTG